jgi:hypothetical protein
MGKAVEAEQDDSRHRPILTVMLPLAFREALLSSEEVLVASREDGRQRAIRTWYAIGPAGELYLFNYAYARRVARWRKDPWVRLSIPGTDASVEGRVRFIGVSELDPVLSDLVVERWGMWGATTPQGLRRMLLDGSHVLVRVDVP